MLMFPKGDRRLGNRDSYEDLPPSSGMHCLAYLVYGEESAWW